MIIQLRLAAFVFVACLTLAAVAQRHTVPITQVDVFARNAVAPVLVRLRPADAVAEALGGLPAARQEAFAGAPFGSALAGGEPLERAVEAVTVAAIAPERLRVRIASADEAAAQAVAESVRRSLVAAGLDEKFSIFSTSSGGPTALALWLATAFAGAVFLLQAARRMLQAAKARQPASPPMPGAASI